MNTRSKRERKREMNGRRKKKWRTNKRRWPGGAIWRQQQQLLRRLFSHNKRRVFFTASSPPVPLNKHQEEALKEEKEEEEEVTGMRLLFRPGASKYRQSALAKTICQRISALEEIPGFFPDPARLEDPSECSGILEVFQECQNPPDRIP